MQAVILAAGLGTRLRPFTLTTPKALIPIGDKTLIEHTLDALPRAIDEIFIVVNYLGDQIKAKIGNEYRNIPVRYVTQDPLDGTGGAMILLRNRLHDRFLVVNGDDLYSQEALDEMLIHNTSIMLCPTEMHLMNGGKLDANGKFIGLVESTSSKSYRVCGAYVLDQTYFEIEPVKIEGSVHEEYGLPQTLATRSEKNPIDVVLTDEWYPIGTPEELEFVKTKNIS
ncbi:MAG: nucleotidyltransferase family protein [Candidatus Uhrbacteria bacterium]|nr:nucleotidyltransferase family protein [Candidatus Uhrbacteria bacterium]